MIATPPFAPMAAAYDDHPPTAAETQALLAFLQRSAQHPQAPGLLQRQGSMLLGAGAGALLVLLLLQAAWRRRKTLSTKHAIYARQSRRG